MEQWEQRQLDRQLREVDPGVLRELESLDHQIAIAEREEAEALRAVRNAEWIGVAVCMLALLICVAGVVMIARGEW